MFGEWLLALLLVAGVVLVFALGTLVGFVMGWREAHLRDTPASVVNMRRKHML